jgi:formate hydrogenlyase transcriptional activator
VVEDVNERAMILSKSSALMVEKLNTPDHTSEDKIRTLADQERDHINKVLDLTHWRIYGPKGAAQVLDMNPETLRSRIKKLGIIRP